MAETDNTGAVTWQGSYEAFGKRTQEYGGTDDRQRANTKEEDPTGLLDEGFRFRDLTTGVFLTKDPAGFIDGPNVYTYVNQNPWSKFDPEGLYWGEGGVNWTGNNILNAGVIKQSYQLTSGANYHTLRGWGEGFVGVVGMVTLPIDAAENLTGIKGGVEGVGKTVGKKVVEHFAEKEGTEYLTKVAEDANKASKAKNATKAENTAKDTSNDGKKIPNSELQAPPTKRGNAPTGHDGHPVELHHRGQKPDSPLDEMTRTEHQGKGNFKKNHENTGQHPSEINRKAWKTEKKQYWNTQWDGGRFNNTQSRGN